MGRLLVISEDKELRTAIAQLLRLEGHDVHGVSGWLEGVTLYSQWHFDLILVEVFAPDQHVSWALRQLIRERPSARIVVISSRWDEADLEVDSKSTYELARPFLDSDLIDVVSRALGYDPE